MRQHRQRGTTLIELIIGMVIVGLLFAMGAPSFRNWIQNSQIRVAAEAIQNGLQLARVAAVQRNANVVFQLVTAPLDASCALSTTDSNWVISQPGSLANAAGAGKCDYAPADPPAVPIVADSNPYIIQKRPAAEGSTNAVVAAGQSTIVFNGLGRVTMPVPAANIDIDISNTTGGACRSLSTPTNPMRCLRVSVSPNGQIRMCDPSVTFSAGTPQGC